MKKLTIVSTLALFLTLGACSPKKNTVTANNGGSSQTATIAGVPTGACTTPAPAQNNQQQNVQNVGTIYDSTNNQYNFENMVKSFLSATISPYEVGSISSAPNGQTGVRFRGVVKLDASGNVIGAQSNITISVYDSIWQMNKISNPNEQEIQVVFDPTKRATIGGQFNPQSGEGTLTLQDNYGSVRLTGRIDATSFSGTVSFQNTASVLGSPASGNLGQFYIQRCAILQ